MRPWREGAALLDSRTGTAAKGHREPDRMKILVLSSFAFSLVNFRGRLLSAMAAAGHDVIACAPDTDQEVEAVLGRMGIGYRRTPMGRTGANPFDDLRTLWSYRSEEHTSELQSLMRISYAVFCLKKKTYKDTKTT